jgi:transcriptional regulator with XRE-family HTH domain
MLSFDIAGFNQAVRQFAELQNKTMKQVSAETGVSDTTLSRMHSFGRAPNAASLAALSAWAGINPAQYSNITFNAEDFDKTKPVNVRKPLVSGELTTSLSTIPKSNK